MTNDTSQPSDALSAEEYRALVGKGKRHKYGVAEKAARVYRNVVYDSKLERDVAEVLDLALHADPPLVTAVERQIPFTLPGGIRLVLDFRVALPDRCWVYIEVKGMATREWKLKEKLWRESYHYLPLLVVRSPAEAIAALQAVQRGAGEGRDR